MPIRTRLVTLAFVALALAGCASTPAPTYTKPEFLGAAFDTGAIDKIAAAPVLDMRIDKSEALDLDKHVHVTAKQSMAARGYTLVSYADRSLISTLQAQPARDAIEPMVKDVVIPGGPRHVLVFGLIDAHAKLTFGSTGNAEMVGYLIDQERHEVLWSNKSVAQSGAGGLLGMAMKGLMTQTAIAMATTHLIESIPPRPQGGPR